MPIFDSFKDIQPNLSGPVEGGFDISPSDTQDLVQVTRGVMVQTGGDLRVTLKSGDQVTLPALSPGVIYPLRVSRVWDSGTTATGLMGLV